MMSSTIRNITYIFFSLSVITSCQPDFDEINDTTQRNITFTFSTSDMFSQVLKMKDGEFEKGRTFSLPEYMCTRISSYCYDNSDSLIDRRTSRIRSDEDIALNFRHLQKDSIYHFVFLADFVKQDEHLDYETWFQLEYDKYDSFYLFWGTQHKDPALNLLMYSELNASPANQTVFVELDPLVNNGYIVLENVEGIEQLSGELKYPAMILVDNLTTKVVNSQSFNYIMPTTSIYIPLSVPYTSDMLVFNLKKTRFDEEKSVSFKDISLKYFPCVVVVDCNTMSLSNIIRY